MTEEPLKHDFTTLDRLGFKMCRQCHAYQRRSLENTACKGKKLPPKTIPAQTSPKVKL